jgi:predicted ArsR family transcriptional regulator
MGAHRYRSGTVSDTHSQLTLQLIDSIKLIYGSEGIDKIVSSIEHANTCEYVNACAKATTLEDKVKVLVGIRDAAGYMASLQAEGKTGCLSKVTAPFASPRRHARVSAGQNCRCFKRP